MSEPMLNISTGSTGYVFSGTILFSILPISILLQGPHKANPAFIQEMQHTGNLPSLTDYI